MLQNVPKLAEQINLKGNILRTITRDTKETIITTIMYLRHVT